MTPLPPMPEALTPLLMAFSAGAASALNPCAYALLPAILGRFLLEQGAQGLGGGLRLGLALSVGVLSVFAAFGALVALHSHLVGRFFPYLALVIALGLLVVGVLTLAGRGVHLPSPQLPSTRGPYGPLLFGASFGLASLGCTLPVFLAVVGVALQATARGVWLLVAYGFGMAVVLVTLSVATGLGKRLVARPIRRLQRWLEPLGGLLLLAAATYLLHINLGFVLFDYPLGRRLAISAAAAALIVGLIGRFWRGGRRSTLL
jgi:cytochrome c-type biogenesis protein